MASRIMMDRAFGRGEHGEWNDITFSRGRAIERLLKDPDLRERLGRQSQRYVFEHHTIDRMTEDTLAVYREIHF